MFKRIGAIAALACAASLLVTGCGDTTNPAGQGATSASGPGCSQDVAPIKENPDFVPYEARLTHSPIGNRWRVRSLREQAVLPQDLRAEPSALEGLPAVAAEVTTPDSFTLAYAEQQPSGSESDFLRSGGIVLVVSPGEPGDDSSIAHDLLADSAGDGQIILVDVGDTKAAVSWADPDENGVRPHHVLWTDAAGRDVNLYADRDAEALVSVARSIACS